jgi:hypothetical protein
MGNTDETWAAVYPPLQELKAETDSPWEERRGAFLDKLGLSEPSQDPVVAAFFTHVEDLPDTQRDELLSGDEVDTLLYGFIEQYSESSDSDSTDSADSSAWDAFLADKGPYWDGSEESWPQFYEWFAYEAHQAGVGAHADELLAELAAQDIDDRIITFGRSGVTIVKRKREEPAVEKKKTATSSTGAEPEDEEESRPQKRMKTRASRQAKPTGPPRVTVRSESEGAATQRLNSRQQIGFHMVATLTNPPGNVGQFEFRQFVRDAFDKNSGTQALTGYSPDGPFQPPYEDEDGDEDVNVTQTDTAIVFDDHPGFSSTSSIVAGDWLNSYSVEFYWTVTHPDGRVWQSPTTVPHSVTSVYNGGANVPVTYNVGPDQDWEVTFP